MSETVAQKVNREAPGLPPSGNRNDGLARVCEKHTIGDVLRPISLLDHRKDGSFPGGQNSSVHAGILSLARSLLLSGLSTSCAVCSLKSGSVSEIEIYRQRTLPDSTNFRAFIDLGYS